MHALRGCGGLYIVRPSHSATARMAKSVDAGDLKSLASNGVPVRVRLRAPCFMRVSGLGLGATLFRNSFGRRDFLTPSLPYVLLGHDDGCVPELIPYLSVSVSARRSLNWKSAFGIFFAGGLEGSSIQRDSLELYRQVAIAQQLHCLVAYFHSRLSQTLGRSGPRPSR